MYGCVYKCLGVHVAGLKLMFGIIFYLSPALIIEPASLKHCLGLVLSSLACSENPLSLPVEAGIIARYPNPHIYLCDFRVSGSCSLNLCCKHCAVLDQHPNSLRSTWGSIIWFRRRLADRKIAFSIPYCLQHTLLQVLLVNLWHWLWKTRRRLMTPWFISPYICMRRKSRQNPVTSHKSCNSLTGMWVLEADSGCYLLLQLDRKKRQSLRVHGIVCP